MIFQREGAKPITGPSATRLVKELARVKSSFASLTAEDGSFLQVAGGPGLFALEYRNSGGRHFRGKQPHHPVVEFPDGTALTFTGSTLTMKRLEWFLLHQIAEIFRHFSEDSLGSAIVEWQPLNEGYLYAR